VRLGPSFERWRLTLHSNGQYTISSRYSFADGPGSEIWAVWEGVELGNYVYRGLER
jgi:hypothetical protein